MFLLSNYYFYTFAVILLKRVHSEAGVPDMLTFIQESVGKCLCICCYFPVEMSIMQPDGLAKNVQSMAFSAKPITPAISELLHLWFYDVTKYKLFY